MNVRERGLCLTVKSLVVALSLPLATANWSLAQTAMPTESAALVKVLSPAASHDSSESAAKKISSPDAIIGFVGAILGGLATLFAVRVTEKGSWKREEAKDLKQRQTLRVLILQEIDHNLRTLQGEYSRANSIPPGRNEAALHKLSRTPAPRWNSSMWNNQAALLTVAFEPEELRRVHEFYFRLNRVTDIWSQLNGAGDSPLIVGSDLQDLLEAEVKEAVNRGNALRQLA